MRHTLLLFFLCISVSGVFAQKYADNYAAGKYAKAVRLAEKAIEENSRDLDAHMVKALAYLRLYADPATRAEYPTGPVSAFSCLKSIQRKDKSGNYLSERAADKDSILQAAYALASEWTEKKQYARAGRLVDDLIEFQPAPKYYYLSGRIAEAQGEHVLAVERFNMAAAKIWVEAGQGIAPDPAMYILFADLADAIADDDDFHSALTIYHRGMDLFKDPQISERCYDLIYEALQTYLPGYDTVFVSSLVDFLDSLPASTPLYEEFHALKWVGIMHNYKASNNWWSDQYAAHARETLLYYACKDQYVPAADTLMAEMFRQTRLLINAHGASVTKHPDNLHTWKEMYTCMRSDGDPDADAELLRKVEAYLQTEDFMQAGALLYNMTAAGTPKSITQPAQKTLFTRLQSASKEVQQSTDLYALSLMFPDNAAGKQMQKDASVQTITKLLEKGDHSKAAVKLRAQMQLDPDDATVRALYKKWIVDDFVAHYMGSTTYTDLELWNGSSEECTPGTLPDSVHDKVLERLNYVRRLAGVPDNCVFNDKWNAQCMAAAMMMRSNGDLTHHPPKDWQCYSQDGAVAAGMSNLSLGYGGSEALMGQVDDDGGNNQAVGHRRWILNPDRKVFGHGSNPSSMALWALGGPDANQPNSAAYDDLYVAWPAAWYFPANLVPGRWSLSRSGADFSEATVEMYIGNRKVELEVLPQEYGYGQPTLVWEPVMESVEPGRDLTVRVVVKNIQFTGNWDEAAGRYTRVAEDHTYTVILMPLF